MLVWLKLHQNEFLKVNLTHSDNEIEVELLLHVHIRLNRTQTGLRNLHILMVPAAVFDLELEQHKFVEERQQDYKTHLITRGSMLWIFNKC